MLWYYLTLFKYIEKIIIITNVTKDHETDSISTLQYIHGYFLKNISLENRSIDTVLKRMFLCGTMTKKEEKKKCVLWVKPSPE
jgi:hypothetical protein